MYDKCSIFVGNLAIFCTERDMEEAFSPFGQILSISIKCDEETNKNLSYGFVKYSSEISAHQAMKALNGKILCGRPLRIGKALKEKVKDKQLFPKPLALETSSIHVTYISYQIEKLVTEESLRAIFSTFGDVIDASIKKSTVDQVGNCQSGYGFVHYSNSVSGVESAFMAARSLYDVQIDNINYICKISHALENHLKTHSFLSGSNMMDSYNNGAPATGHPARPPASNHSVVASNASAFVQHSSKDLSFSAAIGTLSRKPLTSHEEKRGLPMNATNNSNYFDNRCNQLPAQEISIPYRHQHHSKKPITMKMNNNNNNNKSYQPIFTKPQQQQQQQAPSVHYSGHFNPATITAAYPQHEFRGNRSGMPFQPHVSAAMKAEVGSGDRVHHHHQDYFLSSSPSSDNNRHFRDMDLPMRGDYHFPLDENRRPFRPADNFAFQESTSGRSSSATTSDSFLSFNDDVFLIDPISRPRSHLHPHHHPLADSNNNNNNNNNNKSHNTIGDTRSSTRDPFHDFHFCNPKAFEDEPPCIPWHANSFSWSENLLPSAQEYHPNAVYRGSQLS